MNKTYDKLLNYAFWLLGRRRYTAWQIEGKLKDYLKREKEKAGDETEYDQDEEIGEVLARLKELKYLDDEQYLKDYVSERVKFKPRGVYLIKNELKKKGIDKDLINQVMEQSPINEIEMAVALLEKKGKNWSKFDRQKIKQKASFFLASKGFKADTVYKAITKCYNSDS